MGSRYIIQVECPKCGHEDKDVYFAPSCGFVTWECLECGYELDLGGYARSDIIATNSATMRHNKPEKE